MAQRPPQVLDLVQRFDRNHEACKLPHYNETQVRREFLDPLFKALGWDTDNEQGYVVDYIVQTTVGQLLGGKTPRQAAKTPQERTTLERQIAATDTQLDNLVHALYGLPEAEMKPVEQIV